MIAVEGAGFAADGLELLDQSHADGLRHLQLVHYIRNAIGDIQTERPEHDGMTQFGVDVVKSCHRLGILVDLAHATNPVIDKAYIDQARKIAKRDGAVGLWSLRSTVGSSPRGYANELMRKAADLLRERGVDEKTLKAVCFENYARCLRTAMEARQA